MTTPTTPSVPQGLGRRFAGHDDRSRAYGVRPLLTAVERKPTFWALPDGPYPLDQGAEGSCTGFGMAHELAAGPIVIPGVDAAYARARYRRNQEEDRAMGNDFPDGATVLATMKAAQRDGLISGYRWAFGVDDVVDTLCSVGPVCLGIEWRSGMYSTGLGGRVDVDGEVVGGHFIDLLGYDEHLVWGPCVLWVNSWGDDYGVADVRLNAAGGVGWLPLDALADLLSRDGEAVVPTDFFVAPTPKPNDPPVGRYYARRGSKVFHRRCRFVQRDRLFTSYDDAVAAGLRPCRWCRPTP